MHTKTSIYKIGGLATIYAVMASLVLFIAAKALGGEMVVAPEFGSGPAHPMKAWAVGGATILGGIAGIVFAKIAQLFKRHATSVFLVACLLGLSIYGLIAFVRSTEISTAIWLNVMHLVAAVPIVGLLNKELSKADAPVNCSLTPSEYDKRVLKWSDLGSLAHSTKQLKNGVVSTYPLDLEAEIHGLITLESRCCGSWLHSTTQIKDGVIQLELTANKPEGVAAILEMTNFDSQS